MNFLGWLKNIQYLFGQFFILMLLFLTLLVGINQPIHIQEFSEFETSLKKLDGNDPIFIDGNTDFINQAASKGWDGDGSYLNPIEIEDIDIAVVGSSIKIHNVDLYFTISRCTLFQSRHTGAIVFIGVISLRNVTRGIIRDNLLTNVYLFGIQLQDCSNISILNNTIIPDTGGEGIGIDLRDSHDNILVNNTLTNIGTGISLEDSPNNTVQHHKLINSRFSFNGYYLNDLIQKNISENTLNGKPIYFIQNKDNFTVPNDAGQIIVLNSSSVEIKSQDMNDPVVWVRGFYSTHLTMHDNLLKSDHGAIYLSNCEEAVIHNNTMLSTDTESSWYSGGFMVSLVKCQRSLVINNRIQSNYGIDISQSDHSVISSNYIYKVGKRAISVSSSFNMTIEDNTLNQSDLGDRGEGLLLHMVEDSLIRNNDINSDNGGITISYSSNNSFISNNLMGTGLDFDGNAIDHFLQDIMVYNTINAEPIHFFRDRNNETITDVKGYLILVNCSSIIVNNSHMIDSPASIQFYFSKEINLTDNILDNTMAGVIVRHCSNIKIYNNQFLNIKNDPSTDSTMLISQSTDINISRNNFSRCVSGIEFYQNINCSIHDNVFTVGSGHFNNNYGLGILESECIDISNNTISRFEYGILIRSDSEKCRIVYNNIFDNDGYGIIIIGSNSRDNVISWNNFTNNIDYGIESQAYDVGINNSFNYNYWAEWKGFDLNNDSFIDSPYPIDGQSNQHDNFPRGQILDPSESSSDDPLFSSTTNVSFASTTSSVSLEIFLILLSCVFLSKQRNNTK